MAFLVAIFIGFILYGLTTSVFPCVWPEIAKEIGVNYTLVGPIMMISTFASGVSSAFAYKLRRKYGTSISITISLILFIVSLFIYYFAHSIVSICIGLAIMGLGFGINDTVENSYVIKAYDGDKISLLHASWGVGATIGPMVMNFALVNTDTYRKGYLLVIVLIAISVILFISLKMYWERVKKNLSEDFVKRHSVSNEEKVSNSKLSDILNIKLGLAYVLCFVLCGSVNSAISAWIATLTVEQRNIDVSYGAIAAAYYFAGMSIVRIILGFISSKLKTKNIIYAGMFILLFGFVLMFLRTTNLHIVYIMAFVIGAGVSPLVPFLHHSVRELFEEKYLGVIVSCSNAASLIGGALVTALVTPAIKILGVNNAQALLMVLVIIGFIIFNHIVRVKTKEGKI